MKSESTNCTNYRHRIQHGCQLWLTWIAWKPHDILRYIPPAGNGNLEMELQRLAAFIGQPQHGACELMQRFGGSLWSGSFVDGQYAVCLDRFRPATASGDCLMYSFGVATDWSLDEAMQEAGCEVHSFDPSIGMPEHRRPGPRHWFHNWGFATGEGMADPEWNVYTYKEIRKRLGHESRRVRFQKHLGPKYFVESLSHDLFSPCRLMS